MLKDKKYFLFDIDGTLAVDNTLFAGSLELIRKIDSLGGRCFYITNNSIKSRKDYVKKFAGWGIKTEESQFMTASYATCRYLERHYQGKKLFVMGTPSFTEEVKSFGLAVTDQAEPDVACVVVGFDTTLCYDKVDKACELLFRPEVDYIGTNPDLRCPTSYGFMPDCGGICQMLNVTTDREPLYMGKPNPAIVSMCMEQVEASPGEVLVVGDRLYTDIACGLKAGVETALVYTGEARPEDLKETAYPPDYVYENVEELLEAFQAARGEE